MEELAYWVDYLNDEKPEDIETAEELYDLMFSTWKDWDLDADDENKMDNSCRANVCYTLTLYFHHGYPVNQEVIKAMIAQL